MSLLFDGCLGGEGGRRKEIKERREGEGGEERGGGREGEENKEREG